MSGTIDWSGSSGDVWARRWRDTDRGLGPVGEALNASIAWFAPAGPFKGLDVGCGPGTTSLAIAASRPEAAIIGCDVSKSLIDVARQRAEGQANLTFVAEDAETAARTRGPFDLVFSRHGVMFFDDPVRAFRTLREAAAPGGALVFSCFQAWRANPWASELADAAAGSVQPDPGREPSGFAFADVDYVRDILAGSGWDDPAVTSVLFSYVAGVGPNAVEDALGFFSEIGPASRVLGELPGAEQPAAVSRIRSVIERHQHGDRVEFPAAAWVWTARA
jgi:SAM-dependent methyltransferase